MTKHETFTMVQVENTDLEKPVFLNDYSNLLEKSVNIFKELLDNIPDEEIEGTLSSNDNTPLTLFEDTYLNYLISFYRSSYLEFIYYDNKHKKYRFYLDEQTKSVEIDGYKNGYPFSLKGELVTNN